MLFRSPNPSQGPLTRDQYYDFIARMEEKQGLQDQPRAVVFHVKDGREHCHVIWSRIDQENLKAIQMSHDRQKIRAVVQEFALEHGLKLPRGLKNNRASERFNKQANAVNLAEKQQEERTGLTKEQRREEITQAFRQSDSGQAFIRALQNKGYILAKGNRRAYVVIDRFGEIHSLTRQIEGVKAKEVKARLADFPLDKLPETAKAQAQARDRARTKAEKNLTAEFKQQAANKWGLLKQKQHKRRAGLEEKRKAMLARHQMKRNSLLDAQKKEITALTDKRKKAKGKGLKAFLAKVTGISLLVRKKQKKEDQAKEKKHKQVFKALKTRQNRQVQDMNRRFRTLASLEKRESRSLNTALQRRQYKALQKEKQTHQQARTKEQKDLREDFKHSQRPEQQVREQQPATPLPGPAPSDLAGKREASTKTGREISKVSEKEETKEDKALAEAFRRAEKQKEKRAQQQKDQSHNPGRGMSR